MGKLPNLFTCDRCGFSIDPKGGTTLRFVSGWVKSQSRSLTLLETEHYIYRHEGCVETTERRTQDPLF